MFRCPSVYERERRCTPSGDRYRYEYIEVIGKDGAKFLEETRKVDVYEFIQTSLDGTLIYNVIDRYKRGDVQALDRRTGLYVDCTGLPTSFLEAHKYVKSAETVYKKLPDDVKSLFGSFDGFRDDLISGSAYKKLTSYELSKSRVSEPAKEVVSDVNATE